MTHEEMQGVQHSICDAIRTGAAADDKLQIENVIALDFAEGDEAIIGLEIAGVDVGLAVYLA